MCSSRCPTSAHRHWRQAKKQTDQVNWNNDMNIVFVRKLRYVHNRTNLNRCKTKCTPLAQLFSNRNSSLVKRLNITSKPWFHKANRKKEKNEMSIRAETMGEGGVTWVRAMCWVELWGQTTPSGQNAWLKRGDGVSEGEDKLHHASIWIGSWLETKGESITFAMNRKLTEAARDPTDAQTN